LNKEESNKSHVINLIRKKKKTEGWGEATEGKKSTARSHLKGYKLSSVNTEAN